MMWRVRATPLRNCTSSSRMQPSGRGAAGSRTPGVPRGGICPNSCDDIDRVLQRPGRNAGMGRYLRRPHLALQHCREISGIRPCHPFRVGGYCCVLACLGPGSRRIVVLQPHRDSGLETIARNGERLLRNVDALGKPFCLIAQPASTRRCSRTHQSARASRRLP
jgi:hypothetical protein